MIPLLNKSCCEMHYYLIAFGSILRFPLKYIYSVEIKTIRFRNKSSELNKKYSKTSKKSNLISHPKKQNKVHKPLILKKRKLSFNFIILFLCNSKWYQRQCNESVNNSKRNSLVAPTSPTKQTRWRQNSEFTSHTNCNFKYFVF